MGSCQTWQHGGCLGSSSGRPEGILSDEDKRQIFLARRRGGSSSAPEASEPRVLMLRIFAGPCEEKAIWLLCVTFCSGLVGRYDRSALFERQVLNEDVWKLVLPLPKDFLLSISSSIVEKSHPVRRKPLHEER